jgi:hypothetical protein
MTPLRRRMIEDMQVRNFSPHTQNSYVQQVSLFARHFSKLKLPRLDGHGNSNEKRGSDGSKKEAHYL